METRVLKTDQDYRRALREAERLVSLDPEVGTRDGDRLELLALLIEDFEKRTFLFDPVDPVHAIEFRMQEQGLRQKDLVPLLGSRSRVSEVLGRKRPLTVQMIRALSAGLGIPAAALVAERASRPVTKLTDETPDWTKFPVAEMERRGWFKDIRSAGSTSEQKLRAFLSQVLPSQEPLAVFRRQFRGEAVEGRAYYSTLAWCTRVLVKAKSTFGQNQTKYDPTKITPEILRDLARLSWFEEGPKLAMEFLAKIGIVTVVEPRLPNAIIDGAALLADIGRPVIGLTLRIDRIDYFWFTLLHEVAHIWRHLDNPDEAFIDRLDRAAEIHTIEKEANRIARDSFIRRAVWERCRARLSPSKEHIQELADELHIHPAIIVGRLQYETGRYESFRDFLGQGTVRHSLETYQLLRDKAA